MSCTGSTTSWASPGFFALEGDVGNVLELTTVTYRAQLAAAAPDVSRLGGAQVRSADACVTVPAIM